MTQTTVSRALGAALLSFAVSIAGCTSDEPADAPSNPATDAYATSLGIDVSQFTKLNDDVYYRDLVAGGGATAAANKTVRVFYTGWLPNGQQFESNVSSSPIEFVLGTGYVIPGWDQGLVGMQVGGKRRLLIGSRAAYGRTGSGKIPPNSTIVFDVELVSAQ